MEPLLVSLTLQFPHHLGPGPLTPALPDRPLRPWPSSQLLIRHVLEAGVGIRHLVRDLNIAKSRIQLFI